jgi:bacterioferritin-associated ferredoxin
MIIGAKMIMSRMYICICNAITDRQVRECAAEGARSVDELAMKLGVGAGCGRCRECAAELLSEACGLGSRHVHAAA